jgi:hypothetical protein
MCQVLGVFGLLDFTMLRPVLTLCVFWNLRTIYFFNFTIFVWGMTVYVICMPWWNARVLSWSLAFFGHLLVLKKAVDYLISWTNWLYITNYALDCRFCFGDSFKYSPVFFLCEILLYSLHGRKFYCRMKLRHKFCSTYTHPHVTKRLHMHVHTHTQCTKTTVHDTQWNIHNTTKYA